MRRLLILSAACMLFTGCIVALAPWEPKEGWKPGSQTDISGVYLNFGELDPKSSESGSMPSPLTMFLFKEYEEKLYYCDLIEIRHRGEHLDVLARKNGQEIGRTDINGTFNDGIYKFKKTSAGADIVAGIGFTTISLYRSSNYLVLKQENQFVGVFIFIPTAGSWSNYYRYRKTDDLPKPID